MGPPGARGITELEQATVLQRGHGRVAEAVQDGDHRPRPAAWARVVHRQPVEIVVVFVVVPLTAELVERAATAEQLPTAPGTPRQVAAEVVEAAGLDPAVAAPPGPGPAVAGHREGLR